MKIISFFRGLKIVIVVLLLSILVVPGILEGAHAQCSSLKNNSQQSASCNSVSSFGLSSSVNFGERRRARIMESKVSSEKSGRAVAFDQEVSIVLSKTLSSVSSRINMMPFNRKKARWAKVLCAYRMLDVSQLEKLQYAFPDEHGAQLTVLFFILSALDLQASKREEMLFISLESQKPFLSYGKPCGVVLSSMSDVKKKSSLYKKLLNIDTAEKH